MVVFFEGRTTGRTAEIVCASFLVAISTCDIVGTSFLVAISGLFNARFSPLLFLKCREWFFLGSEFDKAVVNFLHKSIRSSSNHAVSCLLMIVRRWNCHIGREFTRIVFQDLVLLQFPKNCCKDLGLRICSRMRVLFVRKPLLNWFPRPEKSSSNQRARFWTFEGNSTDGDFFSKHVELIHLADLGFSKKTLLSYFFISISLHFLFHLLSSFSSCLFSCLASSLFSPLLSSPLFSVLACVCVSLFVCCCLCVVVCIRAHAEKHVRVLTAYTGTFWICRRRRFVHTQGEESSPFLFTKKSLTWTYHFREVHQKNGRILIISSLRIGRERHVPDSSNHSLYLMKLLSSSYPEGNCGRNQLWDGSVCLSPQNLTITNDLHISTATRPGFPLTFRFSSVVHHLSGPDKTTKNTLLIFI